MIALFGHLAPIHPMLVHFPIALLVTAAIADSIAWVRKSERFSGWGCFLVASAALFALPTVASGLLDMVWADLNPARYPTLLRHLVLALLTTTASGLVATLRVARLGGGIPSSRGARAALSLALAMMVGITALFGGMLVYEDGVGVTPLMKLRDLPLSR